MALGYERLAGKKLLGINSVGVSTMHWQFSQSGGGVKAINDHFRSVENGDIVKGFSQFSQSSRGANAAGQKGQHLVNDEGNQEKLKSGRHIYGRR